MNRRMVKWTGLVLCSLWWAVSAAGTELSIPEMEVQSGQVMDIPVMIDQTDNLAGVKLVMKYDKDVLVFKKADKTKETSSLMHVVNDKTPGSLIVVMAGARGIQGKNFPIVTLSFEIKTDLKDGQKTAIEITEAQLMSDQLKNIEYTVKPTALTVKASGSQKTDKPKAASSGTSESSQQTAPPVTTEPPAKSKSVQPKKSEKSQNAGK